MIIDFIRKAYGSALVMVWVETITRFGMGLLVLPMAVVKLTDLEFSIWLLFNIIFGLALLADSGFGPSILRATSYFCAGANQLPTSFTTNIKSGGGEPNWERVHVLLSTSFRIYCIIGLGALLLMVTIGTAMVWNLMSLGGHTIRLWVAFGVLVVWGAAQVMLARWSGILEGLGKVAVSKRIGILAGLFQLISFLVVLWCDFGVLGICCAGLLIVSLSTYLMRRAVYANLDKIPTKRPCFEKGLFQQLWPSTWRQGAMKWGAYMIYNGGGLVVAQMSDTKLIASYLLTLRVVFVFRQIAQAPMVAYMPKVISSLARQNLAEFREWTLKITTITLSIFSVCLIVLILCGDLALGLFGSQKEFVPLGVMILLFVAYLLELHHTIHASLYIATNHVPFLWPSLLSGVAIVGFGSLFVKSYGLYGLILTQIVVQALCNNWLPVYLSLRLTNWGFFLYIRDLLKTLNKFVWQKSNKIAAR